MTRLRKIRVAPQQHLLETTTAHQLDGPIQHLGRAFMGGSVARPIHQIEHLVGLSHRHYQRMIAPVAGVAHSDSALTLSIRRGDRPVHINRGLTVKLLVLVRPHFPSRLIDRFHQIPDRIPVEAPQEVPLRGRRRHLAGPQRVQIHRVPASSLHVLQAATARHDVVNQIEHMIRFPVRQMPLQHLHPLVDGFGQFQLLDQQLDHTQPPAVHGSDSIRNLIMDVAPAQHPLALLRHPTPI